MRAEPISRFYRLHERWDLQTEGGQHSLFDRETKTARPVSADVLYVLQGLDAKTDFTSAAFLPKHRALLKRLCESGIVFACPFQYDKRTPGEVEGVFWAITGRCNLGCGHCYMSAPSGGACHLSTQEMLRILREIASAGATQLSLTGGEVFMRGDLPELLRAVCGAGLLVSDVLTNAVLVMDESLRLFDELGMRPHFHVSFDGVGHHDRLRGVAGTERRTIDGIRRIQSTGFRTSVITCADPESLDSLTQTYTLMRELRVSGWGIGRPMKMGCAKQMKPINTEVFAKACGEVQALWLADGRPMTIGLEAFFSDCPGETVPPPIPFRAEDFACASCRSYPYVAHDGQLMPCSAFSDTRYSPEFPNLLAQSWESAWNSAALREKMDITYAKILENSTDCAVCEHLLQCKTGCRASAVVGGGTIDGRDDFACEIMRGKYQQRFREWEEQWSKRSMDAMPFSPTTGS